MTNRSRLLIAATAVAALVSTATASAGGDSYRVQMDASSRAAASAVVLSNSDLGGDWVGGAIKPNLGPAETCGNYNPRMSDLVVNGAATTQHSQSGIQVESIVQVLETPEMVRLDFKRTVLSPTYLSCMRTKMRKAFGAVKAELLSIRRLPVPRLGERSIGFRMVVDYPIKSGGMARIVMDWISFTKGRTEVSLQTMMPIGSVATMAPNEAILAKLMLQRVRV